MRRNDGLIPVRTLLYAAAVALALALACAFPAAAQAPYESTGGVAGGGVLWMPDGDIYARNISGGTPDDPNLDLGAGSATDRGTISLNFDVGRCTIIYDGHKRPLARFCPRSITFYVKPRIRR